MLPLDQKNERKPQKEVAQSANTLTTLRIEGPSRSRGLTGTNTQVVPKLGEIPISKGFRKEVSHIQIGWNMRYSELHLFNIISNLEVFYVQMTSPPTRVRIVYRLRGTKIAVKQGERFHRVTRRRSIRLIGVVVFEEVPVVSQTSGRDKAGAKPTANPISSNNLRIQTPSFAARAIAMCSAS